MFSEFVEARAGEAGQRSWAIVVSTIVQAMCLLVMLLAPLVYTQALPMALLRMKAWVAPPMPLVEAPEPPKADVETVKIRRTFIDHGGIIYEPKGFPSKPLVFEEPALPPEMPGSSADFGVAGLLGTLSGSRTEPEPVPVASGCCAAHLAIADRAGDDSFAATAGVSIGRAGRGNSGRRCAARDHRSRGSHRRIAGRCGSPAPGEGSARRRARVALPANAAQR